jgi:O-antigen ligase
MLQEMGIPGALLVTVLLIGMPAGAARLARRSRDPVIMATSAAIAGIWVGVLAMSWGSQPFLGNPITAVYWILAGVLATLRRLEAETRAGAAIEQPQPASREPRPLFA